MRRTTTPSVRCGIGEDGPVSDAADLSTLRSIALQRDPHDVIAAAVSASRNLLGVDRSFAALPDGDALRVKVTDGIRDPRFAQIRVRLGRGLGGQVIAGQKPMRVDDYATDPRITRHFVDVVTGGEGLRSIACVPVRSSSGEIACLLYCARSGYAGLGDRDVAVLEQIASFASVGLELADRRRREIELSRRRDRHRLAMQLHDTVAQALFAIGAAAHAGRDDGEDLAKIAEIADQARADLRGVIEQLEPVSSSLDLDERLQNEVRDIQQRMRCDVRVVRRGGKLRLSEDLEDLIADTVVEGIRNAIKHGGAKRAVICIDGRPEGVVVAVQAERSRVPEPDRPATGTGLGLEMLRAHARRAHGRLDLELDDECSTLRLSLGHPRPLATAE